MDHSYRDHAVPGNAPVATQNKATNPRFKHKNCSQSKRSKSRKKSPAKVRTVPTHRSTYQGFLAYDESEVSGDFVLNRYGFQSNACHSQNRGARSIYRRCAVVILDLIRISVGRVDWKCLKKVVAADPFSVDHIRTIYTPDHPARAIDVAPLISRLDDLEAGKLRKKATVWGIFADFINSVVEIRKTNLYLTKEQRMAAPDKGMRPLDPGAARQNIKSAVAAAFGNARKSGFPFANLWVTPPGVTHVDETEEFELKLRQRPLAAPPTWKTSNIDKGGRADV